MKPLPKAVGIPLGIACIAAAAVLVTASFALLGGKVTIGTNS